MILDLRDAESKMILDTITEKMQKSQWVLDSGKCRQPEPLKRNIAIELNIIRQINRGGTTIDEITALANGQNPYGIEKKDRGVATEEEIRKYSNGDLD
jgi:hypothetical protein